MRGARSCIVGTLVCMLTGVLLIQGAASFTDPDATIEVDDEMVWEGYSLPHADVHSHWSCGYWVFDNIYETLYTYPWDSVDATPSQPLLASSLDISEDGLNYTFTLREGVRFHDGTPFNATCVQMNFWRILGHGWDASFGPAWMVAEPILGGQAVQDAVFDYGDGSPQHIGNWTDWVENSGAVEVLDTYKVRIRLAYPYTPFLAVVSYTACSMISPTFFMAHGGMAPGGDISFMAVNYCGTGPYRLREAVPDGEGGYHFFLTLNEDYWRTTDIPDWPFPPDQGHIKEITIKQFRESTLPPLVSRIKSGAIDGVWGPRPSNISEVWNGQPPPEIDMIWDGSNNGYIQSSDPAIRFWQGYPGFLTHFLGFNLHPYLNMSGEVALSPWVNKDLRYAISYAFDYQKNIDDSID